MYICFILQTAVPPVRMEEPANVHLTMLTVTVPVGTRDPTARPEVCIAAHTLHTHSIEAVGPWNMHVRMYIRSPVCQNRGTSRRSSCSSLRSLCVVFATQGHTART